jgi:hypothetical protein
MICLTFNYFLENFIILYTGILYKSKNIYFYQEKFTFLYKKLRINVLFYGFKKNRKRFL